MQAEILKKITIKDVMGDEFDAKKFIVENPKAQDLIVVIGTTSEVIADSSQYGDFFKFVGAFEATRLSDGVVFKAPNCIIPEPLNTLMGQTLMAVVKPEDMKDEEVGDGNQKRKRKRGKTPAAQFGIILGIKPSKKGATGYEWTSKPVVEVQAVDTLKDLRAQVNNAIKALPAPKAEEKTTKK